MRHLNIVFIVTGAIGILLPMLAPSNKPRLERRFFWAGFLLASISAFFIFYPPDGRTGVIFSLLACFTMLTRAYMSTSYIKIGGKIYAFHLSDSRPDPSPDGAAVDREDLDHDPAPDSYSGLATPGKTWSLLILGIAICSLNVVIYVLNKERPVLAAVMAAVLVGLAVLIGYGDSIWGYSIARGQRIQFFIISIITAGVFTVFYLGAYFAGKRWPWRNKRSLEYRAHPRHQKRRP
jgi:hypothetical protein